MLTQEQANELFDYDESNGHLIAKVSKHRRPIGSIVGRKKKSTFGGWYLAVTINSKFYFVHRVIWLMQTGGWPDEIDHINGDGLDNRWKNLRNVSNKENKMNLPCRNKLGVHGIRLLRGKYHAYITTEGKQQYLYYGDDFFEAVCARKSAESRLGFHENHGRKG